MFFNITANTLPLSVQILHKVPSSEIKLSIYYLFRYQLIFIPLYCLLLSQMGQRNTVTLGKDSHYSDAKANPRSAVFTHED